MKKITGLLLLIFIALNTTAQLKNILKKNAEQRAANTTEKGLNDLFKKKNKTKNKTDEVKDSAQNNSVTNQPNPKNNPGITDPSLTTYTKYDFVPGEKVVAYADFSQDEIGDFPAHWNTNTSGEVMTVEGKDGKWLSIPTEGYYIPMFISALPDNFTLEYDVLFIPGSESKGPNTPLSGFQIASMNAKDPFEYAPARAQFEIDPRMGTLEFESYASAGHKILANSAHLEGLNKNSIHSYHVAVWRQKQRVRVYLDQDKICDLPMVLSETEKYNAIRFRTELNNNGSNWLISNLKLAIGAPDTRNKLMTEGKFSTTGILFDVNSANIKAESYGTLKQVAMVLQDNATVKIRIVGHTDSDGDDAANLSLSKQRAEAVKASLFQEFSIDEGRMQTDGKGESQPGAANTSQEGKAQNRRVEFIKL